MSESVLPNFIDGAWVPSTGTTRLDVRNPATNALLAQVPLSTASDVDRAVQAAQKAFPAWRETPPVQRARYLFKFRALLDKHADEIARICTSEHGKTFAESRNDIGRGIENVEHACGTPSLLMGQTLEDVAHGIDCEAVRQPMGVFAAIAPFNFPPMVPLWFLPYAIATGNTFILKPSEQVPLSQKRIFELLADTGLPAGVVNLVNGGKEVVDALCTNPGIVGVSFVGSTPVARHVYSLASQHGKRVQSLGGAKNYLVVMPDAVMPKSIQNVSDSIYGCAGQRCLAGSIVIGVGDAYEKVRDGLVAAAKAIVVGDGTQPGVTMGPVISARHKDKVLSYIQKGVEEGAKLLLDGRTLKLGGELEKGNFLGPTVFEGVRPEMTIVKEEIFGPVVSLMRAKDLNEAIEQLNSTEFANAASIYTSSGKSAREFKYRAHPAMLGVNIGVAAPMSMFPFGGSKQSFFGDVKAHGSAGVDFYTDKKVVIQRWF
jgi:malonate-semialdehyde dehydrogenase (acetylating)/methylmalonate-semialdehyde dehydrogenase